MGDISPQSILLYFDNPLHEGYVNMLSQLNDHAGLVGPPGYVEEGCAVIAPWEGRLYRAVVLSRHGTTMTVLYVDHGNTDQVSWWGCFAVPSTFHFPTLATQVRLAKVRTVGEQWNNRGRELLYTILDSSQGIEVIVVESKDEKIVVELKVGKAKRRDDVGELLVGNRFAEFDLSSNEQCQTDDKMVTCEKISNASSNGTLMSNFLGREEECYPVNTEMVVQEEETLPVTEKVILVGNFDKNQFRGQVLPTIKQKWEGVKHVVLLMCASALF